ncbi:MAG: ATP synthase F1 subunit gamma [Cyanobacteria bacterium]|nr:ATP synthase F1 subunit gamma [Cyanobacteriota bacterium]
MPNLKDIRRRIKSVKNTQKITQAMRMVAAAKVKRAENRVKATRPYAQALLSVFRDVYTALIPQAGGLSGSKYGDLLQPRTVKNVGIIVYSSDRGLCGAFNSTIIRQAFKIERELLAKGLTPKFYLVGNKAVQAFNRYSESPVLGKISNMTAAPSIHDANTIASTVIDAFLSGEIDQIEVLSTHFKSMISYKVETTPLIPVILPEDVQTRSSETGLSAELSLEPSPEEALERLVPMYLSQSLYALLLESAASELAARMTAMANATNNASDMIGKLTILYNKARQATITQELLEVVGGAEALN